MAQHTHTGYAEVNGAKLYYEVAGEGHPFVLIHGGLVDSRSWDDQFDTFAQHYKVIRYDLPGFGKSDLPTQSFAMHENLYGLLKFLGIEKVYVLGLSLGGSIDTNFALAHPEMVDALILVAPGVGGYSMSEANRALGDEADAAVEGGDLAKGVEMEVRMWVDGPERTPEQVDASVRERVREMNTHNYELTQGKEWPELLPLEPPAIGRLGEIHVPTLVVVGDKDISDMHVIADMLTTGIAGAKKVVIPDTAHALNMEKSAEFNRAVLDFLGAL